MDRSIPSPEEVAAALAPLSYSQMQELSRLSGVPFTTLWKVKTGETKDPGLSKVRAFWPHVAAAAAFRGKTGDAAPPTPAPAEAPPLPEPADAHPQAERAEDRRQTSTPEYLGTVGMGRTFGRRESDAHEGPTGKPER